MKSKYPVKKLVKFNFWLTAYFFLLGFVTTMASVGLSGIHEAISRASFGALLLLLNAFTNLWLIIVFKLDVIENKNKHKTRFLITSIILNSIIYLSVTILNSLIFGNKLHAFTIILTVIISVLVNILIIALQNFIVLLEAKAKADIENSKLRAANADAANQLLRQQIHPHFLFNALNILKSLYRVNAKLGEEYLIRLSDFLRAAVSNNNIKTIPLKEELKLCKDYLEMQRIRFNNSLEYSVSISEEALNSGYVPSFSIQPLLENAIKHNELTEESPLHIFIQQDGDRIKIINNLKRKNTTETSTGSGLMNLTERYRLLSGEELFIDETDNTFTVSIKILKQVKNGNNQIFMTNNKI
jgi:sensor histidine kinase YesM